MRAGSGTVGGGEEAGRAPGRRAALKLRWARFLGSSQATLGPLFPLHFMLVPCAALVQARLLMPAGRRYRELYERWWALYNESQAVLAERPCRPVGRGGHFATGACAGLAEPSGRWRHCCCAGVVGGLTRFTSAE